MGTEEDILQLRAEMEACRTNVHKDIKELKEGHIELRLTLREQAVLRARYHDEVKIKLNSITQDFKDHTSDEMENIGEIARTLKELTSAVKDLKEDTINNTDFIEDIKKRWFKYSMIATGVGGTLVTLYSVYKFLDKNGIILVIEKAGN